MGGKEKWNQKEKSLQKLCTIFIGKLLMNNGYRPSRFHQMLDDTNDGVITAQRLLADSEQQYGFIKLIELGAPELTVEAHVLKNNYIDLFDKGTIERAAKRIKQFDSEFLKKNKNNYTKYLKSEY